MRTQAILSLTAILAAFAGCNGADNENGAGRGWSLSNLGGRERQSDADSGQGYSILLSRYQGPGGAHRQLAQQQRAMVTERFGWENVYVIHRDQVSELYWGRYDDPARAGQRLRTARAQTDAMGQQLFPSAIITPIPGEDVGPEAWKLANNPGTYSLLVAVFKNDHTARPPYTTRREDAVAYCRQLREQGYEAWYFHGGAESSVTIGSFGPDAIEIYYETVETRTSPEPVRIERSRIVDPQLNQLRETFTKLAYNGHELINVVHDARTGQPIRQSAATYPIRVESARE